MAAAPAWAQDTAGGPDYERCAYDAVRQREASALDQIDCQIEAWKEEDPIAITLGQNRNLVLVEGSAIVGFNVENRNWGRSRALAYSRAFLDAMGQFVRLRGQQLTAESSRIYFDNSSTNIFAEAEPASYLDRMDQKEAILAEGRLDQALKDELGMSDAEVARLTPADKVTQLRDQVLQRTFARAFGSASGLVPVQTFEAIDSDGSSAIGVMVVFSERMARLATMIAEGRAIAPDPQRARDPVELWVSGLSEAELTTQFGVRRVWDEHGYPVVVSFGQWGWSSTNLSNRQRDRARRAAERQAENIARSNLADFISVATSFADESIRSEVVELGTRRLPGGLAEDFEDAEIVDLVVEQANTKSEVQLTGLGILRTWSAGHPIAQEHELVGVVAYWSPAREDTVRRGLGLDAKHAPPASQPKRAAVPEVEADAKPGPTGRTQSKPLMDANDF